MAKRGLYTAGARVSARYEIERFIGAGGFASVYAARDLDIDRPVAIKILNIAALSVDPRGQEVFIERFRREAQVAARIRHPNAVAIHDIGVVEESGEPFLVMELLEGRDLEDELRGVGPMGELRAIQLMIGSLEALGEGHDLGIVHKDLKPANLFLTGLGTRKERMRVLDFGIARITDGSARAKLTGTGQVVGTPQYLAPEYIEEQHVSPALDVYQMGLILVEMLTGVTVVDNANPIKILLTHSTGDLDIPEEIQGLQSWPVIKRALAVDHTERYADADAFSEALIEVLSTAEPSILASSGSWVARSQMRKAPSLVVKPDTGQQEETTLVTPINEISSPPIQEPALAGHVPVPVGAQKAPQAPLHPSPVSAQSDTSPGPGYVPSQEAVDVATPGVERIPAVDAAQSAQTPSGRAPVLRTNKGLGFVAVMVVGLLIVSVAGLVGFGVWSMVQEPAQAGKGEVVAEAVSAAQPPEDHEASAGAELGGDDAGKVKLPFAVGANRKPSVGVPGPAGKGDGPPQDPPPVEEEQGSWSLGDAKVRLQAATKYARSGSNDRVVAILSPILATRGRPEGWEALPVEVRVKMLELLALTSLEKEGGSHQSQIDASFCLKEILKLNPDFEPTFVLEKGETAVVASRLFAGLKEDPPDPVPLHVTIKTRPLGAKVVRDGKPLNSPAVLRFESSKAQPVRLQVRAADHSARWITVKPTDGTLFIKLKRLRVRSLGIVEDF